MKGTPTDPILLEEVVITRKLLHQELVKENQETFIKKVILISLWLKINPDWLMQAMYKETGGTFSPSVKNGAGSGAVGLIQFMPSTAKLLGISIAALSKMTAVEQLDYVYRYLNSYTGRMQNFGDVYLAIFYPKAMNKPNSWLLPASVTAQNKGLDLNKDGRLSRGEIVAWASVGMD